MLKACQYCHKIHAKNEVCPLKPQKHKDSSCITKFRSSKSWQKKRAYIAERDLNLCRLCAIGYENKPILYKNQIEIHHIVPLAEDWSKRLEDDNLIALCKYHHEMAESGIISRDFLCNLTKRAPGNA